MSFEILVMDLSTSQAFVAWMLCSSDYIIQKSNIQIIQAENTTEKNTEKKTDQKKHIKHNEQLAPYIEKARASVDGTMNNIKYIIVNTGPGSFTGLRISLALAKGIQSGLQECTIIGINAMEFWHRYHTQQSEQQYPLLTVLDARSNRFYTALTSSSSVPAQHIYDINAEDIITLLEHTLPPNTLVEVNGFAEDMLYAQIEQLNSSLVFKRTDNKTGNKTGIPSINMLADYFIILGLEYSKKRINILKNDSTPLYVRSPV